MKTTVGILSGWEVCKSCVSGFGGKKLKERDHLEDLGLDGRLILK
jgi:viroplasmin and RNaseH domain-containing protein